MAQVKELFNKASDKVSQRLSMQGLLKQASISLEEFLSPKILPPEEEFSKDTIRHAHGIALITEAKGGFIVSVKGGTGIILCKTPDGTWSAPCAVGTGGLSWGFQAGASKCDHVIILSSQHHVRTFMANGGIQVKGSAQAAVANVGRDAGVGVGVSDKDAAPILSYSFGVKGLFAGVSLEGAIISSRDDCNEGFYGKKVKVEEIATGEAKAPTSDEHYDKLVQMLTDFSKPRPAPAVDAVSEAKEDNPEPEAKKTPPPPEPN